MAVRKDLHCHVRNWVAPIGITRAAADGPHLHRINLAGCQSSQNHPTRLREHARRCPAAAVFHLRFIRPRIVNALHSRDELRGHAIVQTDDARL